MHKNQFVPVNHQGFVAEIERRSRFVLTALKRQKLLLDGMTAAALVSTGVSILAQGGLSYEETMAFVSQTFELAIRSRRADQEKKQQESERRAIDVDYGSQGHPEARSAAHDEALPATDAG